jgi:hypothetical protein
MSVRSSIEGEQLDAVLDRLLELVGAGLSDQGCELLDGRCCDGKAGQHHGVEAT